MNITTLLTILVLIAIAIYLMSKVFRNPTIDIKDFKENWRSILLGEVAYYINLTADERSRFERDILLFFKKVKVTGVDTDINYKDRLLVACSAVIPLFGYPGTSFDNLSEVLIYKGRFNRDYETDGGQHRNILGMVGEGSDE